MIRPLQGVAWKTTLTSDLGRIERLYRDDGDRIWRALLAYAGDPEVASDALAEALTQALARDGEIRDASDPVWTTSFRTAAGELKHRGRSVPFDGEAGTYDMPEPAPHLLAALATLPPKQRMAVVLHDYADRPTDEIAELLGVTRPTVHVHLSQGRKRLEPSWSRTMTDTKASTPLWRTSPLPTSGIASASRLTADRLEHLPHRRRPVVAAVAALAVTAIIVGVLVVASGPKMQRSLASPSSLPTASSLTWVARVIAHTCSSQTRQEGAPNSSPSATFVTTGHPGRRMGPGSPSRGGT